MNTKTLHKTSHATNFGTNPARLALSRRSRISALLSLVLLPPLSGTLQAEPTHVKTNPVWLYVLGTGTQLGPHGIEGCTQPDYKPALIEKSTAAEFKDACLQNINSILYPGNDDGLNIPEWFVAKRYGMVGTLLAKSQHLCADPIPPGDQCGGQSIFAGGGVPLCPPGLELKNTGTFSNNGYPSSYNGGFYCEGILDLDSDIGGNCPATGGSNPIEITTGIKTQPEVDYAGPDGLSFVRTYRSKTGRFESILTSAGKSKGGSKSVPFVYYPTEVVTPEGVIRGLSDGDPEDIGVAVYELEFAPNPGPAGAEHHTNANGDWLVDGVNGTRVNKNPTPSSDPNVWVNEFTDRGGNVVRYNALGKPVETWSTGDYANRLTYTYYTDSGTGKSQHSANRAAKHGCSAY